MSGSGWLVVGGIALFWVAMLGLLWRRSLVGMLVGLAFGWVAVALATLGFVGLQADGGAVTGAVTGAAVGMTVESVVEARALGSVLAVCVVLLGGLQVAVGLAVVVARIERRGTLDADDAGLLEG